MIKNRVVTVGWPRVFGKELQREWELRKAALSTSGSCISVGNRNKVT
jgi:hypothetical protein